MKANTKAKVKMIGSTIVAASVLLSAVACGPAQEKSAESKDAAAPKQVNLRFVWWGGDARHKATIEAIEKYQKLNPNVKIEPEYGGFDGYFQKLTTQLAGGTAPDILQIDSPWLYDFSKQGEFFVDLNKIDAIDKSIFNKKFLDEQSSWKGKLQGLPTGVIAKELFIFNQDFFTKHNIDPNTQWTWDKLIEVGERVHKENNKDYLLHTVDHIRPLLTTYMLQKTGESLVKDDFTISFDEKLATEAFAYLKTMLDKGVLRPFEESTVGGAIDEHLKWQSGESGIMMDASSVIPKVEGNSKFKLGVAPLPILQGTKNTGIEIRPAQLLAINANSKNVAEAAKFLNWFFKDKDAILTLKDSRGIPSTDLAMKLLSEAKVVSPLVAKATDENTKIAGQPLSPVSFDGQLIKIFTDLVAQVAYKKLTPEQAGAQLVKQYKDKLQELKATSK
ncbi:ABC transporter substrate-binding protein [Paenibacillus cremeus]|uniref:Carbohydrate ABC transporter substrate-binding protein n=1 Tax=Paenibacillus cremeus TaxID=2163881 RepID=A0A559K793_9BACL|nr:ABC transporter substrate-binding protein [Paenibacillus cremeus]TVY07998.1 carbohydrate ABC transporter substrate-binding protein [Paenibacillus cremeus]